MKKVIIYALVALGVFTLIISNLGTCSWGETTTTVVDGAENVTEVLTDVVGDDDTDIDDTDIDETDFDDEDGDYDIDDSSTNDEENLVASTEDDNDSSDSDVIVAGDEDETDVVLATTTGSNASSGSSSGKFLVVTGSFRMKENAEAMAKKLRSSGYSNAEVVIFDYSEFYSVVAGRSDSQSSAASLKDDLVSDGIESYVHKMRSRYFNK